MPFFFADRPNGASPRAPEALYPPVLKAMGMDVLILLSVWCQLQVDDEAPYSVSTALFRDKEVMNSERATARSISNASVRP
jgi:hypothetical protein